MTSLLSKEDGSLPVMTPTDPEIMRLVQEGTQQFPKDKAKGAVLLRLAARKGYLPAYIMLAQCANTANDEALMIDALCSMLSDEKAPTQILPDLLSQFALQLAGALRDPRNDEAAAKHAEELKTIAIRWPIVNAAKEGLEVLQHLRRRQEEAATHQAAMRSAETSVAEISASLRAKASQTANIEADKRRKRPPDGSNPGGGERRRHRRDKTRSAVERQ